MKGADLESYAVLPGKSGGCQIGRLVPGVVSHLSASLSRVNPIGHLIDLELRIPWPLESEGDWIIQEQTDSLQDPEDIGYN